MGVKYISNCKKLNLFDVRPSVRLTNRTSKVFGKKKRRVLVFETLLFVIRQKLIKIQRNQLDPIGSAKALHFGG